MNNGLGSTNRIYRFPHHSVWRLAGGLVRPTENRHREFDGDHQRTLQAGERIPTRIIDLQKEVLAVRNENAQLKAGQELMTAKMTELQRENAELKQILTKIKHK